MSMNDAILGDEEASRAWSVVHHCEDQLRALLDKLERWEMNTLRGRARFSIVTTEVTPIRPDVTDAPPPEGGTPEVPS
jgi:hypothetical protein